MHSTSSQSWASTTQLPLARCGRRNVYREMCNCNWNFVASNFFGSLISTGWRIYLLETLSSSTTSAPLQIHLARESSQFGDKRREDNKNSFRVVCFRTIRKIILIKIKYLGHVCFNRHDKKPPWGRKRRAFAGKAGAIVDYEEFYCETREAQTISFRLFVLL